VALITPVPDAPFLSADFVRHLLGTLARRGFHRAITGALSPLEQSGFLAAGFDVERDLTLLRLDFGATAFRVPDGPALRRVPAWRRNRILSVDHAAFADFWRFDALGLKDALEATPSVRLRMAGGPDGRPAGYAICGLSGRRGFVQRLAVAPGAQGSGMGRRLLLDGLVWMQSNGVERAVVNTQVGNDAALSLYRSVGFVEEPLGLSVLSAGL
jgi:ribosomal protein S18 acetylase RimI-like enzyme